MKIISKKEAEEKGVKKYFTGKSCKKGHISERLVSNYGCTECIKFSRKKYYSKNVEQIKATVTQWRKANPGKYKQHCIDPKKYKKQKQRRNENIEKYKEIEKRWRDNNEERRHKYGKEYHLKNREYILQRSKQWRKSNPHKVMEYHDSRNEQIKIATPSWANQEKICEKYIKRDVLTEQTGIQHQVDHHYPLKGKTVCGLHVEDNLIILTIDEHKHKGNIHPDDFYG